MRGTAAESLPDTAAGVLTDRLERRPEVLLVLGSGLGGLAEEVRQPREVGFEEVPGLPGTGVSGHAGRWRAGRLEGREVLVQEGRHHLYEGHSPAVVTAPIRIAAAAGAGVLLITNAAGGIRDDLAPGTLALLHDQVDLTFRPPRDGAKGAVPGLAIRRDLYDPELRRCAVEAAGSRGLQLPRAVYAGLTGPSYETPAEIRMLERLGADLVGMSTVHEVKAAWRAGLRPLGLSLVTNRAAGLAAGRLSHGDVVETASAAGVRMARLVRTIVREVPDRLLSPRSRSSRKSADAGSG